MFNRRMFIATAAATAVVTALPAVADTRPKIGAEFYIADWRYNTCCRPYEEKDLKRMFERTGKERGVYFGNYTRDVVWHPKFSSDGIQRGGPWAVVWEAEVIGYV